MSVLQSKPSNGSYLTQSQSWSPYSGPQALHIRSFIAPLTSPLPALLLPSHWPPYSFTIASGLLCLGAFALGVSLFGMPFPQMITWLPPSSSSKPLWWSLSLSQNPPFPKFCPNPESLSLCGSYGRSSLTRVSHICPRHKMKLPGIWDGGRWLTMWELWPWVSFLKSSEAEPVAKNPMRQVQERWELGTRAEPGLGQVQGRDHQWGHWPGCQARVVGAQADGKSLDLWGLTAD